MMQAGTVLHKKWWLFIFFNIRRQAKKSGSMIPPLL